MKKILGAAMLLIGVAYAYPLLDEGVVSICHAFERRGITESSRQAQKLARDEVRRTQPELLPIIDSMKHLYPGDTLFLMLSDGSYSSIKIKTLYPNLPPSMGCAISYWKIRLDVSSLKELRPYFSFGIF